MSTGIALYWGVVGAGLKEGESGEELSFVIGDYFAEGVDVNLAKHYQ
jgi:hypothetical protein